MTYFKMECGCEYFNNGFRYVELCNCPEEEE